MIFLTGPHGAGKTTVAEILSNHKFFYLDLGGILRKKHWKEKPEIGFGTWCAENEKKYGTSFTDDIIVCEIKETLKKIRSGIIIAKDLVVVGSRSAKGISYIIERVLPLNGRKNFIIYIDAPENILMQRYCDREDRYLTLKEFKQLLKADIELGLLDIISFADVKMFNTGSIEDLKKSIKDLVFTKLKYLE